MRFDVVTLFPGLVREIIGVGVTGRALQRGLVERAEPGKLWENYLDVIDTRETKLLEFLSAPRTMSDIINAWIVYRKPREPAAFFAFAEEALMRKHIERLIRAGSVIQTDDGYERV